MMCPFLLSLCHSQHNAFPRLHILRVLLVKNISKGHQLWTIFLNEENEKTRDPQMMKAALLRQDDSPDQGRIALMRSNAINAIDRKEGKT